MSDLTRDRAAVAPPRVSASPRLRVSSSLALMFLLAAPLSAQELAPPGDVVAADTPSDDGAAVYVTWAADPPKVPDATEGDAAPGRTYVVEQARSADGPWGVAATLPADTGYQSDVNLPFWMWRKTRERHYVQIAPQRTPPESAAPPAPPAEPLAEPPAEPPFAGPYYFRVVRVQGDVRSAPSEVVSAMPRENWFKAERLGNLLILLGLGSVLFLSLEMAKRRDLFLRKIPGLASVDEALGRATEMGLPVIYMTGRLDMNSISTIAASIILGEVAKKTAQYDVQLEVPHSYSVTMAVCREITRNAYLEAGRPDSYSDDINYYVTEEQFSYAANINGKMLRDRPGAVFYMGYYYAESLLMAEAGATTGAIQIAGTNSESQLPFFVTSCDYTLMGEELFAASAYLSRKPELIGTLRGQDLGKLAIMTTLLVLTALVTAVPLLTGEPGFRDGTLQVLLDLVQAY